MSSTETKNAINLAKARKSSNGIANQAKSMADTAKNPTSLLKYIEFGNDWPYVPAVFVALLKDLLDFIGVGSLPAIGTVITIICSIFIFFMMLLVGGSKKGRAAKAFLKGPGGRFLLLGTGAMVEMLFGINFLPIETLVVLVAYWMLLMERKESESK
jgi:hypothetical protein